MTIDLTDPDEPKLSMSGASPYFASSKAGRPAHKSRIIRYITKGVIGPNGVRVYLGAVRQGNQWVTTPSAIQAFSEALTPKTPGSPRSTKSTATCRKAADRAGRELTRRGI